MYVKNAG